MRLLSPGCDKKLNYLTSFSRHWEPGGSSWAGLDRRDQRMGRESLKKVWRRSEESLMKVWRKRERKEASVVLVNEKRKKVRDGREWCAKQVNKKIVKDISYWTILSTVTTSDLSNCQHHHDMTIETPNTGWGEPTLFCSISPRHDHWEWHMSKTPPPKMTIERMINITPNRLRRTNSTSRAEDIVTEDAKVVNANLSWNICDPWLITCASFLVCQGVCFSFPHWVQVRRSQADKPIHSPRDSLISWR